jgi:hypothetical protein
LSIWEGIKGSLPKVKDFRGCLDLVDTVLDGYIIAFIAEYCHFRNVKELLDNLECIAPKTMAGALEELNAIIRDHTLVTRMRQKQPTERDMQYEDLLLFIQSGLILRSFGKAMRIGDSGLEQLGSYASIGKYIQKAMRDNGKSGMEPEGKEPEGEPEGEEPEAGEGLHEGGSSHEELESLDEIDLEGFMEEGDVDEVEILFN